MLALVSLLSSCNLFGGNKMKAPTFAKEGDEVEFTDYQAKLAAANENSELSDQESKLSDRLIKSSYATSETVVLKRGKTEVRKSETATQTKGEMQIDYSNLTMKETGETKGTYKRSDQEGSYNITANSKTENYGQFATISDVKSWVSANAKTKVYTVAGTLYSGMDKDDYFDSLVRMQISNLSSYYFEYEPDSKEQAKDYLFYINNDVLFTISYNNEKDEETEEAAIYTKSKIKLQLDMTDKKQAVRVSVETEASKTYKKDGGYSSSAYKEGDVETTKYVEYYEATVSAKDVTVKEVDLDDYTKYSSVNPF